MLTLLPLLLLCHACSAAAHPPTWYRSWVNGIYSKAAPRSPYSYQSHGSNSPYGPYMVGEQFFKDEHDRPNFGPIVPLLEEDFGEEMPYTELQDYGSYARRAYPEVVQACTQERADLAADPLANLEHLNPWRVMTSRRYQKTPDAVMFKRLFKYISGVNQEGTEIEMTSPVTVHSKVMKEDPLGDVVVLMMCFYLPAMYQPNHEAFLPSHSHQTRGKRHASVPAPVPSENSLVFLHTRPAMEVYVQRFGGFAFTAETWQTHMRALREQLIGKKVNEKEYFSVGYDPPMQLENRRNEVWVQSLAGDAPDLWPQGEGFTDGVYGPVSVSVEQ